MVFRGIIDIREYLILIFKLIYSSYSRYYRVYMFTYGMNDYSTVQGRLDIIRQQYQGMRIYEGIYFICSYVPGYQGNIRYILCLIFQICLISGIHGISCNCKSNVIESAGKLIYHLYIFVWS
ncbi:hypothetical protein IMSAG025_00927 [Muribaculaceae bacterium]|nr:hypothetical protein IMSAG025_00927 [Muribaculaceae bacterium]